MFLTHETEAKLTALIENVDVERIQELQEEANELAHTQMLIAALNSDKIPDYIKYNLRNFVIARIKGEHGYEDVDSPDA